jgi:hypothetical protein
MTSILNHLKVLLEVQAFEIHFTESNLYLIYRDYQRIFEARSLLSRDVSYFSQTSISLSKLRFLKFKVF